MIIDPIWDGLTDAGRYLLVLIIGVGFYRLVHQAARSFFEKGKRAWAVRWRAVGVSLGISVGFAVGALVVGDGNEAVSYSVTLTTVTLAVALYAVSEAKP